MKTSGHSLDQEREVEQFGALTDRTFAAVRFILAAGGSVMIYVATEPERYVSATYYSLIAYTAYSLAIYLIARRKVNFSSVVLQVLLWTDIACYSILTSLSAGTNNLFSVFYLFAIIVASSRCGKRLGLWVTLISAVLFITVGVSATTRTPYELNRFLLRRSAMVAIGYILAYWGGAELALKKRLALLRELSLVANPRFGVDRTIEQMMRRLLRFYDADHCLFLLSVDDGLELHSATRQDSDGFCRSTRLRHESEIPMIELSDPFAAVYTDRQYPWSRQPTYRGYTSHVPGTVARPVATGKVMADVLNARSFLTVPVKYRDRFRGRLVVSSARPNTFDIKDASFLVQVVNQVLPVIDNIRLVDRMASDASEEERRRIARSVHDRVIQPYFGLQIGLKALHELLRAETTGLNGGTSPRSGQGSNVKPLALIEQLMAMTSEGIDELREYIDGLRQSPPGETRLVDSIRRFAGKFENATGIQVSVVDDCGQFAVNDRLKAEVFQMTAEGLSNVHRHTHARSAEVKLDLEDDTLVLCIGNEVGDKTGPIPFSPFSISERAEALGGRTQVLWPQGWTVVRIEVPL